MTFKLPIIYEDPDLMVINKPAGIVVNRADSVTGNTVQDFLDSRYTNLQRLRGAGGLGEIFLKRSGIAHRLDKETSGCLLAAKNPESLQLLMQQFKIREVKKTYLALVHGRVEPKEGWWYWPIKRGDRVKRDEFKVHINGKIAQTNYRVIKYLDNFTLLACYPVTGRTHQIRVHAAFAGYPLVADIKYAAKKIYKEDITWCPRHFLHALEIAFNHPKNKQRLTVRAELPDDLSQALNKLGGADEEIRRI